MGKISNSINHYLSDNRRFADLFNGICFQGEAVIHAEDLLETSQVYQGTTGEAGKTGSRKERIRDVCKLLRSGETLRVLALENQEMIDYAMPFRCMQYDVMEYGKQLDALRKKNRQEGYLPEDFQGLSHADVLPERSAGSADVQHRGGDIV